MGHAVECSAWLVYLRSSDLDSEAVGCAASLVKRCPTVVILRSDICIMSQQIAADIQNQSAASFVVVGNENNNNR